MDINKGLKSNCSVTFTIPTMNINYNSCFAASYIISHGRTTFPDFYKVQNKGRQSKRFKNEK